MDCLLSEQNSSKRVLSRKMSLQEDVTPGVLIPGRCNCGMVLLQEDVYSRKISLLVNLLGLGMFLNNIPEHCHIEYGSLTEFIRVTIFFIVCGGLVRLSVFVKLTALLCNVVGV